MPISTAPDDEAWLFFRSESVIFNERALSQYMKPP